MTEGDGIDGLYARLGQGPIEDAVRRFYASVPDDPILGPMYPDGDWAGAEHRLRTFLVFRLGGPQTYIEERGHPRLRMRHAPFVVDLAARDRWVELMTAAVEATWSDRSLDPDLAVTLLGFLGDVATFLINRAAT